MNRGAVSVYRVCVRRTKSQSAGGDITSVYSVGISLGVGIDRERTAISYEFIVLDTEIALDIWQASGFICSGCSALYHTIGKIRQIKRAF